MKGKNMEEKFKEIDDYWSDQRILETYIRGKDIELGSAEYWKTIEEQRYLYHYYLPSVLEYFKSGNGSKLLEVGCGMGVDLAFFIRNGFDCIGIDIAQGHLRLAERYMEYKGLKTTLLRQNAEQLEFEDEYFDCAYSMGVLHHTPNPQNGVDEIYRILRKGGRCVVMLYHKYSLNNLIHLILRIPYDNIKERKPGGKDASYVYKFTKKEVYIMFKNFENITIKVEYAFGSGWGPIYHCTPKILYKGLSKTVGWHLVVYAQK